MAWDDDLHDPHRAIAASTHPRVGVLAGPGTGKTKYGLMRRVARLLEEGTPGSEILLISFTRVAAADLRDKIAVLEAPDVESVRATTLHGYCFGLLQRDAVLAVTGRVPRILLDHEVDLLLRDIGEGFGTIHQRRRSLEAFVAGWARCVDDHPGLAGYPEDRAFEHAVMRWLRDHQAMLIGEVVPEAYRYLCTNPAAEELGRFRHIIVDEYQDLNLIEQKLLDELAGFSESLTIAGDDDQSIYSVRYANPDGIRAYIARQDVEPHSIQTCGRSPANIVAMANSLIRQAPKRNKTDLVPLRPDSHGSASIVQWTDADEEVEGIVSAVASTISAERREPGDILVLTNWRKSGERIRARLNDLEIPARSFFTEEELSSDEGRYALAMLRLVVNEADGPAMRVLVGLGDATGRSDAYQRILQYARQHSLAPGAVLARLANGEKLGVVARALVTRYQQALVRAESLRRLELQDLVSALLPEDQLVTADLRAVAIDALAAATSADELLRAVVEAVTQDDVPQNPDFVRIMSMHKSKGLTSPSVYIVSAILGVVPTIRTDQVAERQAAMEEGRRLFYVAVTRASEELTISGALRMDLADASARGVIYDGSTIRPNGGRLTVRTIAAPYIAELGPEAPDPTAGRKWLASL